MFTWPSTPSTRAPRHELADFIELTCWRDGRASATHFSRLLGRLEENDYSISGVPEEETLERTIEEAYEEIEHRYTACRGGYPFRIENNGYSITYDYQSGNPRHYVYQYLLLATRLNMNNNRNHAGIDGTLLFEKVAAETAREYFGSHAESLVFGTAAGESSFESKVNDLCNRLQEGGGFQANRPIRTTARDGKLDVVVWKPFTDGFPGKLIGFGQCKTGTHYRDSLTQLQPMAFRDKWLRSAIVVPPVRMFFVTEALSSSKDERTDIAIDAGLLFDRCRIVDFCNQIDAGVMAEVTSWAHAAANASDLRRA